MKAITEFTAGVLRQVAVEDSAFTAHRLTHALLSQRITEMDDEVWNPRLSTRRYVRLRARRAGLLEAQAIVDALLQRLTPGQPKPPDPAAGVRPRPRGTYGSGA